MAIFNFLKKSGTKLEYRLVVRHPCHCGSMSFGEVRYEMVHCKKCGSVYVTRSPNFAVEESKISCEAVEVPRG